MVVQVGLLGGEDEMNTSCCTRPALESRIASLTRVLRYFVIEMKFNYMLLHMLHEIQITSPSAHNLLLRVLIIATTAGFSCSWATVRGSLPSLFLMLLSAPFSKSILAMCS